MRRAPRSSAGAAVLPTRRAPTLRRTSAWSQLFDDVGRQNVLDRFPAAPDTAYAYANATYSAYAAAYAAANATDAAAYAAAYAAYALAAHASYTAAYADYVTANAAHTTNIAVNATNIAIYARVAAQLRFRVLATMATAGMLPVPKVTT